MENQKNSNREERGMTVKECYEMMGADYESVIIRLRKDDRIRKFLLKVPEDPSYALLCSSLQEKKLEEAFRAAHTLKGISQNLSLTDLCNSVSLLTDKLRDAREYREDMGAALEQVRRDYERMAECVRAL